MFSKTYSTGYTDNGELLARIKEKILENGYVVQHKQTPADGLNHVYVYLADSILPQKPSPKDETEESIGISLVEQKALAEPEESDVELNVSIPLSDDDDEKAQLIRELELEQLQQEMKVPTPTPEVSPIQPSPGLPPKPKSPPPLSPLPPRPQSPPPSPPQSELRSPVVPGTQDSVPSPKGTQDSVPSSQSSSPFSQYDLFRLHAEEIKEMAKAKQRRMSN